MVEQLTVNQPVANSGKRQTDNLRGRYTPLAGARLQRVASLAARMVKLVNTVDLKSTAHKDGGAIDF